MGADSIDTALTLRSRVNPGDVIAGKYRVERLIGSGGMGIVVEAQHLELGQSVAIKLLGVQQSQRPAAAARFLREGRAAAALTSDHVVRIYDVGTLEDGAPFMVMELLRGIDLGTLLDNVGLLRPSEAVEYVSQAALAIAEAHEHGIVHRDLKPSNLFVVQRTDGTAALKVLDFGISKSLDPDEAFDGNLTAPSSVMGSPAYMSPEQVRDAKNVDTRTDIWSLGVILHELVVGAHVFDADTLPALSAAIVSDAPTPLCTLRADVPELLEAIVLKCLEKDPARRFQSARDLVAALAPLRSKVPPNSSALYFGGATSTSHAPGLSNVPTLAEADCVEIRGRPSLEPCSHGSDSVRVGAFESPRIEPGRVAWAVGAIVAAATLVAVTWRFSFNTDSPRSPAAPSASVRQARAAARTLTLFIESVPTSADVFQGERRIGTTPLQVSLVKERQATTFTLRRPGYQPHSLVPGHSDGDVRVVVVLVPELPPAPTGSPPIETATPYKPAQRPHAVTKVPASVPAGDIRLQR